jgi:hypothetical protein
MFSLISLSNNACRRAAQLFITIVIILVLGKLITLVPVMHQLQLADTFKAADIIWFLAKLAALVVFFLFARYSIEAIPNNGGTLSFVRGIAEPLTVLLIVIMGQALLWQLLAPFVDGVGRTIYNSTVIILIVCISVWFVLKAYRHALYIMDAVMKVGGILSRLIPQQKIVCDQCHAEISTNANFCNQCGHKIQKSLCCSECGEAISEGQRYCQNCGSTLSEVTTL